MNINAKSTNNLNNPVSSKPVESVETAGSLAYVNPFSYFSVNTYDTFDSTNPFAGNIDFASYAEGGETVACSSFMSGFANAVATVGTDCSGAGASAGFSGGDCGGGGCSSGSFSSFV